MYPDDSDDPDELLKHADVAMYRSKELGRNTYQFLDASLAEHRVRQHSLETSLRAALRANQLQLLYQPLVRIADGAVIGAGLCCAGRIRSTGWSHRRRSFRSRRNPA